MVYDGQKIREEINKLLKDVQDMEEANNKLLSSLLSAVNKGGDFDAIDEKGYLMTLTQMQAVNNTLLSRITKLLILLVTWRSYEVKG